MIRLRTHLVGLLCGIVWLLGPASALAGWLGFRNDTKTPLVIQTSTISDGGVTPGRPMSMYPAEVAWDNVVEPCIKNIAIYDPKQPKRPLFETKIQCGEADLFFSVQMPLPGQFKLVPAKPPSPPPRRDSR